MMNVVRGTRTMAEMVTKPFADKNLNDSRIRFLFPILSNKLYHLWIVAVQK